MSKVLIADISISHDMASEFQNLGFVVLDVQEMTERFLRWNGWAKFDRKSTLLIFPGNGANIIKKYLPEKWVAQWKWIGLFAKRFWEPGCDPIVIVDFVDRMILGANNVIVVDDVVSSGATARKVRKINDPWIPGVRWHAATWVIQRAARLKGFDDSFAVEMVGERDRKVSVNSLSTLILDNEIAESFASRKLTVECSLEFHRLLAQLKS